MKKVIIILIILTAIVLISENGYAEENQHSRYPELAKRAILKYKHLHKYTKNISIEGEHQRWLGLWYDDIKTLKIFYNWNYFNEDNLKKTGAGTPYKAIESIIAHEFGHCVGAEMPIRVKWDTQDEFRANKIRLEESWEENYAQLFKDYVVFGKVYKGYRVTYSWFDYIEGGNKNAKILYDRRNFKKERYSSSHRWKTL